MYTLHTSCHSEKRLNLEFTSCKPQEFGGREEEALEEATKRSVFNGRGTCKKVLIFLFAKKMSPHIPPWLRENRRKTFTDFAYKMMYLTLIQKTLCPKILLYAYISNPYWLLENSVLKSNDYRVKHETLYLKSASVWWKFYQSLV